MKVEIVAHVPVDKEHGISMGRVFKVSRIAKDHEIPSVFVMGEAGEEVGLLRREFEKVPE